MTIEWVSRLNDSTKWLLEVLLKLTAIVVPFVLVFMSVSVQSDSLKKYEREKLYKLLNQLEGEMGYNLQLLTDQRLAGEEKMRPVITVESVDRLRKQNPGLTILTSHTKFVVPDIRLKTIVWRTANTRDYFFLMDRISYYNINAIYTMYEDYNLAVDKLEQVRIRMSSVEQSTSKYQYSFNLLIHEAKIQAEMANTQVNNIKKLGKDYENYTREEMTRLEKLN